MFRVEWVQAALDELATLWTEADGPQRQAITTASNAIEQRLSTDPTDEGESRTGRRRITFIAPLVVDFQLEARDHIVVVLRVRLLRRRTR